MLDRTQAPPIRSVGNIVLPEIEKHKLPNGGNLYIHREKNTNAFKIELLTRGGNISASNTALVQLSMKMLAEGTLTRNGHQISEHIDSLGSFLEITPGFDHSSISIYGLKKFFKENIQVLSEMLYESSFEQKALNVLKEKEENKLKMNQEKGSYISSINLRKSLFPEHPYGYSLSKEDIEKLSVEDILAFYSSSILSFDIYLSGDLPLSTVEIIQTHFSKNSKATEISIKSEGSQPETISVRDSKFIQSSIKIGKRLFNRTHSDYFKFIVTNEVLGGFFGSRLMKNIREEKGFTYGIYSSLYPLNKEGYFLISTDVKGENEKETLNEIKKEIVTLQEQLIVDSELETVKNYMIGSFVNSFSSPFASITKFKTLNSSNIEFKFYEQYINQVRNVSAEQIQQTAQQYLDYSSMTISLVGA